MKVLIVVCRLLVGIIFVFSGLVKGVDPLGTAYKFHDYFIAYGTEWANPIAIVLSIGLSALEFLLGFALILNVRMKQISWALLILMIFFTVLTFFDAIYAPVDDCGCFGDAIKLSNWNTFYKNLVLLALVAFIFKTRKRVLSYWPGRTQWAILLFGLLGFVWFSIYNLNHLPVWDFRNYKVGNDLTPDLEGEWRYFFTYENKKTGEQQEFESTTLPENLDNWEYVSRRDMPPKGYIEYNLTIEDHKGDIHTDSILAVEESQLLVIAWNLKKSDIKSFDLINEIYRDAKHEGLSLFMITDNAYMNAPDVVTGFIEKTGFKGAVYYSNENELKAMIRSNPGLILIRDGKILAKWHYNDLPDFWEIKTEYIE